MDPGALIRQGEALLIVPPFAGIDRPSLAAHVLQASAAQAGIQVSVFYASLFLGARMGERNYTAICYAASSSLIGERFFAEAAYGIRPLGRDAPDTDSWQTSEARTLPSNVTQLEAGAWADEVAEIVAARGFKVVGCTTTFEQTAASIALLNRVKRRAPEIITIIGGANCDGEMADGIKSLGAKIDYIFSGESERSFPIFLAQVRVGRLPVESIIRGEPCMDMDGLATPRFTEFYEQFAALRSPEPVHEEGDLWLPYESSRGCWWGEKKHCTFCGLNAQTMKHRKKSAERVLDDLVLLLRSHPSRKICMADNIMPHDYFRTLLPRLAVEFPDLHIFYEEKSNLSLSKVLALHRAGVRVIQPGIEALSSSLLRRMNKGVTARQNLELLRYARSVGLSLNWNILYAFPGDSASEYEQTVQLLPLISHLNPPGALCHLSIDRFSPYFDRPDDYQITNIRPLKGYTDVLPDGAEIERIAYHFTADYPSGIREEPALLARLIEGIKFWRQSWDVEDRPPPALSITRLDDKHFLMLNSRGIAGTDQVQFLTQEQAAIALVGARVDASVDVGWAIERRLLVELDSWYVPLCCAPPELLAEFEAGRSHTQPTGGTRSLPVAYAGSCS